MRLNDQQKQEIKENIQQARDKYSKDRMTKANVFARRIIEKIYYKKYKINEDGYIVVTLFWWQFDESYAPEVTEIIKKEGYHFSWMWTWWFVPIHTIYITLVEDTPKPQEKSVEESIIEAMDIEDWVEIWQAFAKADNTEEYCWIYMWYKDGRVTKTKIYKDIKPLYSIEEIEVEPIEWNEKDFGQRFLGKRGPKWAMNSEGKFTVGGK